MEELVAKFLRNGVCQSCDRIKVVTEEIISDVQVVFSVGKISVDQNLCFGCGVCVRKCPKNAITLKKRNVRA